jgi:hypothetical protein
MIGIYIGLFGVLVYWCFGGFDSRLSLIVGRWGVLFLVHAGGASHHYIAFHDRGYVENPTIFFLFTSSSPSLLSVP